MKCREPTRRHGSRRISHSITPLTALDVLTDSGQREQPPLAGLLLQLFTFVAPNSIHSLWCMILLPFTYDIAADEAARSRARQHFKPRPTQ